MASAKADINFEKDLFEAANRMRATVSPADYKHIVLPLIFLRYLSLRYDKRRKELEKQLTDPNSPMYFKDAEIVREILEDRDQYIAERVYVLPEEAHWSYIVKNAKQPNIKEILDNAMKLIEVENDDLVGVLPRIYQSTNLPVENLASLIEIFSRDTFSSSSDDAVDVLGRVFEYFIGNFASSEGSRGGMFFTPSSIVELLVSMLEPESGTVLDPACGSGGMFVQSQRYAKNKNSLSFYGQESVDLTVRLGKMNVLMHGINADIRLGDSLLNDQYKDQQFDFVIANPPFNQKLWGAENIQKNDPRLIINYDKAVTDSNANYMWMQHFLYHLKSGGIAGFVMANGAMTTNNSGEKDVRQKLVDEGYIDCIVQLPEKLFFTTGIPCCLFFLSKNRNGEKGYRVRNNEVLFIDARKKGVMVSRRQRALTQEDVAEISAVYHAFRNMNGRFETVDGFCKVATIQEIQGNDYKVSPGIYVGTELEEIDDTPFDEKISKYSATLKQQFEDSNRLQQVILKNLENLID
ncbi:class I SAM-dependent DNA methyltransferase [Cohnella lubricantis]|uniref:site-specific DNA-methyltransferase (adenine-specific) n=1 Tax=Cohnella lubricantis TaxID=2163172 RepID=A0A841T4V7_9BACL|nr:class I SAM-dependent DNA methyltransferase [Cohnella lubricantis]MBB6676364.1 SAM-dependent DNA methyltransferase [Cohnella lubricantis]MBP2118786.1 type I restriction enzyme M protein [Cohnella lubricantis]